MYRLVNKNIQKKISKKFWLFSILVYNEYVPIRILSHRKGIPWQAGITMISKLVSIWPSCPNSKPRGKVFIRGTSQPSPWLSGFLNWAPNGTRNCQQIGQLGGPWNFKRVYPITLVKLSKFHLVKFPKFN